MSNNRFGWESLLSPHIISVSSLRLAFFAMTQLEENYHKDLDFYDA